MDNDKSKYNLTLTPFKASPKGFTWFVDPAIFDNLQKIKVGDILFLKENKSEKMTDRSPKFYLELIPKEEIDAFKAKNDSEGL